MIISHWNRSPDHDHVHFSLNGTIVLMRDIDPKSLREGDTASGTDPQDEELLLWRCVSTPVGLAWMSTGPWNENDARKCLDETDHLVVVDPPDSGPTMHEEFS